MVSKAWTTKKKKTEDISCRKRHWHQAFGSYKKKKGNRKLKECLSGFLLLKIKKENKPKKKKKCSRIAREAHWKDRDKWGVGKTPKRNKESTATSREIFMFFYLGISLILKEQLVEDEETTLVWTRVEQLCGFFGQPRYCGGRSRLLHTWRLLDARWCWCHCCSSSSSGISSSYWWCRRRRHRRWCIHFSFRNPPLHCATHSCTRTVPSQLRSFSSALLVWPSLDAVCAASFGSRENNIQVFHPHFPSTCTCNIHHRPQKPHFHLLVRSTSTSSTNSCFSSICTYKISPPPQTDQVFHPPCTCNLHPCRLFHPLARATSLLIHTHVYFHPLATSVLFHNILELEYDTMERYVWVMSLVWGD